MAKGIGRRAMLKGSVGILGGLGVGMQVGATGAGEAAGVGKLGQDYTTIFHNPDRELYVEGCGLVRLGDGSLVAAVPVVPRSATGGWTARPSVTHIMRSADGGRTWTCAATLPYYTAVPWVHEGALYLFVCKAGTVYRNDDLLLLRSRDGGASWSEPVRLFEGHYWNCHTGMVRQKGRLYWVVCEFYGKGGVSPRGPRVIVGDLSGDVMEAKAWRMSNRPETPGVPASFYHSPGDCLEHSVIDVRGRLRLLGRTRAGAMTNVCVVHDVKDDGAKIAVSFKQFQSMPGGHLKFSVLYDEVSGLFWTPANLATDSQGLIERPNTHNGKGG